MGIWNRKKLVGTKGGVGGGSRSFSDRDALSGLLSRSGFDRRVRALIDAHPDEAYLLVYGDIDRFKVYNDLFGTPEGDRLLAAIGDMLRASLPKGAAAARLRADHFVCCYPRSQFDPDHMLAALDAWFTSYRDDFTFFVRLGIYPIDDPELDVSLMCDRALLALRAAKSGRAGSKYAFYSEEQRSSVLKEQELAGEMLAALEDGQFVPFFQPQYRYATGCMVGAEVLARWNHPEKGVLGPLEFIPVFERNGLVAALDYYMWEQACRCLRAWIDQRGARCVPRLSVNVSRADIYRSDLCTYLIGLVQRYDLDPGLLHLEITETAYMEAPDQLIDAVTKLRAAGFTVEMDDFGSGYSSLNTLKDVPVDVLKLDMGFLDAQDGSRGGLILASVVRMARWLDLPVIAEGVETPQQAAYLSSVGCEYMQGFLFSKPMNRRAFEQMLNEAEREEVCRPFRETMQDDVADFWNADSQLALIFNSYVGAAAVAEYDGRRVEFVRLNRELAAMLDVAEDEEGAERLRKNFLDVLLDNDRAVLIDALRGAEDAETSCELRYRKDGGANRWMRMHLRLLSRTGDVGMYYLLVEETTEKQALRDRLVATRDTIPGGLLFYEVKDDGIRLLDFSDAAADLVGFTREQYQAHTCDDALSIVYPDDRWIIETAVQELVDGGQRASSTIRAVTREGDIIWALVSVSTVYRGDDALYAVAVVIDVTKEKEIEQRLREQNESQQKLYDAIPCGIVLYTVDEAPHIVSVNKKGCDILGCRDLGDYLARSGGNALMPIHPDDAAAHLDVIERLKAGSPPIDFTYRFVRKDGATGWLEGTSAFEVGPDGRPLVQSAFIDVSDRQRKRHEQDLQRYTTVLCSVYEEIFELDSADDTYRLLFSARQPFDGGKMPVGQALEQWLTRLPDAEDRLLLRRAIDECLQSDGSKPVVCTYKIDFDGERFWCQSTFLRVSETSVLCCNKDVTARLSEEDRKVVSRIADALGRLPVGVGIYEARDGALYPLYVNDLMCTMFGFTKEEYTQRIEQGLEIFAREDVKKLMARFNLRDMQDKGFDTELRTKRKDGATIEVRIQGRALREGHEELVYAVVSDITEEVRSRHERSWQNERYRLLSEMTHAISFDYDSEADTVLLYIDRTGHGMEAQVIPRYMETLDDTREGVVHPDSIDDVRGMFESVVAGATEVSVEYRADYYGSGYAWYRANLFVVHDDAGAWHLVGLIENIEGERDLRFRAEYDATTGLSNHAATQELITAALTDPQVRAHSVCVVLDIDDFKNVNDTCGHIKGDELLRAVGKVLRANFRESDVVGRVGGDEFVMLLKQVDLDVALRKLERVRSQISATKLVPLDRPPSISVGVYATRADDRAYRDVFVRADEALYQAKRSGKNRIQVYHS